MKTSIKKLACSTAILFTLLACGDIDDKTENDPICNISIIYMSSSSYEWEKPVMDSRVKFYGENYYGWGDSLGSFDGVGISILTDKNMLMSAFPSIFENEQAECNYFAIYFSYSAHDSYDRWVLSQDMVLHHIKPASLKWCPVPAIPPTPTVEAMLVCDDTAEGDLKDRINLDSIRNHADPNWRCSPIEDIIVDCE